MPQFDLSLYPSQIFWLLLCCLFVVSFMKNVFIPRMATIFKERETLVTGDLEQSREMLATTQSLKKKYEEDIEDNKKLARQAREEQLRKLECLRDEEIAKTQAKLLEKMRALEGSRLFQMEVKTRFQDILLKGSNSAQ
jgi:F-type H+-transporting ATPase subunit b